MTSVEVAAGDDTQQFAVVALRTTGIHPEAVAEMLEQEINARAGTWNLIRVEPIVYNSSTTGYLLVVFERIAT